MLNAKSIYKSIHKSRHIYVYMYDMREHCPPLCWPLLGVEVKHYWLSFAHVLLSFVQYVRWTTKTLTWPTQCVFVCVFETSGFERVLSVCVHGSSFQCTVMYWLLAMAYVARFWEGNALPAIHLHPVWIHSTISNSHTTHLDATCSSPINPVFIFRPNCQMTWSFSSSLREWVCVCVWGRGRSVRDGLVTLNVCDAAWVISLACSSSLRYTAMQFAVLGLVRLHIMLFLSLYVCLRCLLLPILFVENVDDVA